MYPKSNLEILGVKVTCEPVIPSDSQYQHLPYKMYTAARGCVVDLFETMTRPLLMAVVLYRFVERVQHLLITKNE